MQTTTETPNKGQHSGQVYIDPLQVPLNGIYIGLKALGYRVVVVQACKN